MKKILSVLLALVMIVGMIPMSILTASAADAKKYEKITSVDELTIGSVVILACEKVTKELSGISTTSTKYGIGVEYTGSPNGVYELIVGEGNSSGTFSFKTSANSYLNWSSGNSLTLNGTLNNNTSWKVTIASNGDATFINGGNANRQIMWNKSSPRFATYDNSKNSIGNSYYAVQLYKLVENETPGEPECVHANTTNVAEVPATCTTAGVNAGVQCADCEAKISGFETIAALGHDWSAWEQTTAPGCTTTGEETASCSRCTETKTQTVAATGHTYVDGVCACGANQADVVSYEKVTAETITAGTYVIGAVRTGTYPVIYLATKTCSNDWSVSDNSIEATNDVVFNDTFPADAQIFVLEGDKENGFTIGYDNGTEMVYLGYSDITQNRKLGFKAEYNTIKWTIADVENGGISLHSTDGTNNYAVSQGDNITAATVIRGYNAENKVYNGIYLFKEVAGGEVEPEDPETPACEHANQTTTTVNATCGVAGSTTVTCDDCGETISTTEIPATGEHSYANGVCSVCGAINSTLTITEATAIGAAMDHNTYTTGKHYVTGVVESIANTKYGNLYIQDEAGNKLYIYGVYSADGNTRYDAMEVKPEVGDTVTLYGIIGRYNSNAQMKDSWLTAHIPASVCAHEDTCPVEAEAATCTQSGYTAGVYCNDCESYISGHEVIPATGHIWVDGACDECGEAQTSEATISFASTEQRVSQDGSTQVWSNAGLTVTNNKANSTNAIIDSSNPVRFYKGSEIVIVFPGMTKIEVTCDTAAYATALKDSINDDNATVSVNDTVVTIVLSEAANSYSVQLTAGQVRVDAITVVAGTCAHVWGELVQTVAPTCTTTGTNTSTCALCGETKEETIAATGHTYNFADDSVSCDVCDFTANKTNIGDLPYANSNNLYYIEGTVTYVNGRNVYMEDATGGICVYYAANEQKDVAQGDVLRVVDSLTLYNDLLETTETLNAETQKVSSGNALPNKTITVAELLADASADKNYLGTRITLNQVTLGEIKTDGNTTITDDNGNSTIIRYMPAIEGIAAGDVVNVTAVVSIYKGTYQLLINKSTAAQDVVKCVVAPSIELTHISLDPTNDALGFKATITGDLPEGAKVGIIMSVEGGLEKTYLVDAAELKNDGVVTLRLKGIMANNGGEMKITGTPVIVIGEETTTGTSVETTMKDAIETIDATVANFSAEKIAVVKAFVEANIAKMEGWAISNIQAWIPEA